MRVSEDMRQCVAFLGVKGPSEGIQFIGTVFFVAVQWEKDPNKILTYLVTARHVAKMAESKDCFIRYNTTDGSTSLATIEAYSWQYHWNRAIDIAIRPGALPNTAEWKFINVDMFATDSLIESKEIGTGDSVFITGLFSHFTGDARNLPIVRTGNIAMMPEEKLSYRGNSIDAYLIEARSIGGLSGSPVFVQRTVTVSPGIQVGPPQNSSFAHGEFYFLGSILGHWDISVDQMNDLIQPDKPGESVNMGIAVVVPAKNLYELLYDEEVVDQRNYIFTKTDPITY